MCTTYKSIHFQCSHTCNTIDIGLLQYYVTAIVLEPTYYCVYELECKHVSRIFMLALKKFY